MEANYKHKILVEVHGNSTITGTQAKTYAIQVYEPDAANVTVRVYGGTFSTNVNPFLAGGCVQTESEGIFAVNSNN